MGNFYSKLELNTESDVEQKFIFRLLTEPPPIGLGYSGCDFITKPDIRKLSIDKGKKSKLYYPDYIVVVDGVPGLIIEAKAPNEDLVDALRQARLYATEINSQYKRNINPCAKVIVTDGKDIVSNYWDTDNDPISFKIEEMSSGNDSFARFIDFACKASISKHSEDVLKQITKGSKFFRPTQLLGGKTVANETVGENSFGANVSLEYKYLFNPGNLEEREDIARNAYVPSKRRLSHVAPIDKIIRASITPSQIDSIEIKDTTKPKEIIEQLANNTRLKNELCLLVGDAGSGKSTFTDYLRLKALPSSLISSSQWININLNTAPLSRELIYKWIISEAILEIKKIYKEIDFDHIETLKKLYAADLNKIERGRASLYEKGSDKYVDIIVKELERLQSDYEITLKSIIDYLFCSKNKLLVIVLDNCDKRNKDDQLLMFEVATWLKERLPCMIFLPLRDTTYDQFGNVPPLDTVIKDLVFRIDPPLLERVVYERLNYALREIKTNSSKFHYFLPNNSRVECSRDEVGVYLKCIVASLFQNAYFRRIISGLAGRNIRKGLEVVLNFCKSGYITEEEIFKIRQSKGDYQVQAHLISKILIKGKRKYYNDEESVIKNLFFSSPTDPFPDPFVRISILSWLKARFREYGPNRTKGYHKICDLSHALQSIGHSQNRIIYEIGNLAKAGCIITESLNFIVTDEDLISITPSGIIHLDLMRNINYMSSVSEDTYFRETQVAKIIADNITGAGSFRHSSKQTAISCSKTLIDYMFKYYNEFFPSNGVFLDDKLDILHPKLLECKEYIDNIADKDKEFVALERLIKEYPNGMHVEAQVVAVKDYGVFVEFGLNGTGLIHKSKLKTKGNALVEEYEEGDWLQAEIVEYSKNHGRFNLKAL